MTGSGRPGYGRVIQRVLAVTGVLFGIATIFAGGSVLAGSDPGYAVYRPLLVYNTAMGLAYVAAGHIAWRDLDRGKYAAAAIFLANSIVLAAIGYRYATGDGVAVESLRAMVLRTVVWLVLFVGLAWLVHRRRSSDSGRRVPGATRR